MRIYIVRGFCSNGSAVGAKRALQNTSFTFLGPTGSDVLFSCLVSPEFHRTQLCSSFIPEISPLVVAPVISVDSHELIGLLWDIQACILCLPERGGHLRPLGVGYWSQWYQFITPLLLINRSGGGSKSMEETLELKRDLIVNEACFWGRCGNRQTASYCQVLSSWWFGEEKGKKAWVTKCSSQTVGVLTYNCTTAAVHSLVLIFQQKLLTYVYFFF